MTQQLNTLPRDTDIEKAVLGALLAGLQAQNEVFGILPSPDCFYAKKHALIYKSILTLKTKGIEIDLLTVTNELRVSGELENVGGAYELTLLSSDINVAANIEDYAKLILEKYILRELIRIGMETVNLAYKGETDVFELIDKAQTGIYQLTSKLSSKEPKHIGALLADVLHQSEMQRESGSEITGVECGITEIDKKTHGWQDGDLVVIGARPAVGKTAFSLNLALGAAMSGYTPLIFSLEMSNDQLIKRMAANFMTLEAGKLFNPVKLNNEEWGIYVSKAGEMAKLPVYIDDTASLTTSQIRANAYKLINKGVGIDIVIIDYLQLISSNHIKGRSRENEVSAISRELKILAKDLQVPVIVLSQLNRAGDGKPTLANLRESGAIEQDADIVMFLYNGENDLKDYVIVDWAKFRNGSIDEIAMNFQKQFQRFVPKEATQPLTRLQPMIPDNPRAGINNNYFNDKDDLPF